MMTEQYVVTTLLSWLNNIVDNNVHAEPHKQKNTPAGKYFVDINCMNITRTM